MPAVPRRGSAFQAPRESAPSDRLPDNANHVEPRPIAPATMKENNNPMSSRTFSPASAGTLDVASQPGSAAAPYPRSMSQTYNMIPKNCRPFGCDHARDQVIGA